MRGKFNFRNLWYLVYITVPIIVADQVTKLWALARLKDGGMIVVSKSWFNLIYTENRGGLWGMGNQLSEMYRRLVFLGFSTLVTLVIVYLILLKSNTRLMKVIYALVLGGAVGNLIDRFYLGYVVDFIDWHTNGTFHWATFNIADVAIVVAVGLIIIESFLRPHFSSAKKKRG